MANGFKKIRYADSFSRDFKGLDQQQQLALRDCLEDLLKPIIPSSRRFHCVDKEKPKIYTVDLYTNVTTHKVSLQLDPADPNTALLRRVGQHKDIDRKP
ncbi:MAG: hypothetical protein V4645_10180 [Pseudomonadota bacterium]